MLPDPDPVVLLAENDDDTRWLLRFLLTLGGFVVAECLRGDYVMETVNRLRPDLVILNGRLPGEDGWSVCQQLREGPRPMRDTPVIFLSTDGDISEARACAAGCTRYFPVPFSVGELLKAATELVASRRLVH